MTLSSIARIIADLQWREQKPAPREAESHQAYIERRLTEMSHAIDAHKAWVLFEKGEDGMNWLRHLYEINDRARDLYRIDVHHSWGDFYLPCSPHEPFGYERVKDHNLGVFERRFAANRWDFCRPSYEACSPKRLTSVPTGIRQGAKASSKACKSRMANRPFARPIFATNYFDG